MKFLTYSSEKQVGIGETFTINFRNKYKFQMGLHDAGAGWNFGLFNLIREFVFNVSST